MSADQRRLVLIVIGTDAHGCKKLPAWTGGLRASTQSWRELRGDRKRRDLKWRGLKQDPKPANGDGAFGFWTALRKVFATSQEHHCRVHKTVNVMRAMPKSVQAKDKGHLHDIRQAWTKSTANAAVNVVAETCVMTRDKAVAKPVNDRGALPTFL